MQRTSKPAIPKQVVTFLKIERVAELIEGRASSPSHSAKRWFQLMLQPHVGCTTWGALTDFQNLTVLAKENAFSESCTAFGITNAPHQQKPTTQTSSPIQRQNSTKVTHYCGSPVSNFGHPEVPCASSLVAAVAIFRASAASVALWEAPRPREDVTCVWAAGRAWPTTRTCLNGQKAGELTPPLPRVLIHCLLLRFVLNRSWHIQSAGFASRRIPAYPSKTICAISPPAV